MEIILTKYCFTFPRNCLYKGSLLELALVMMMDMETSWRFLKSVFILSFLLGSCCSVYQRLCFVDAQEEPIVTLQVDASNLRRRPIPETLFGIFFEVLHNLITLLHNFTKY